MKRSLVSVTVALGLVVGGTVEAWGRGGQGGSGNGNRGSNSTPSNFKTNSGSNTNSFQKPGKSNTDKHYNQNSFKDSHPTQVQKCKGPNGKYCGSGWCFPHHCCPQYSKCCYSDYWGCNVYFIPSYSCWVWYCSEDQCYYQVEN